MRSGPLRTYCNAAWHAHYNGLSGDMRACEGPWRCARVCAVESRVRTIVLRVELRRAPPTVDVIASLGQFVYTLVNAWRDA
jgi:hypothetical protein